MHLETAKSEENLSASQNKARSEPEELRRNLRSILLIVFAVIWTAIGAVCALISLIFDPSATAFHSVVVRCWARVLLRVSGVHVEVEGLQNFDPARSYVFMSNHQSHYDAVVVAGFLPAQVRFIAKKELYRIPLFGWALKKGGHIRIDRDDRAQAFASYDRAAEKIREGASIFVCAEGTRSADGIVGPFKKGGFVLAIKSGAPIVPITMTGGRKILPKQKLVFHKGVMKMVIDRPIDTGSYTLENKDELISRVRGVIIGNLAENEV
ncbi:MAG: 1-acyl-sn-glycerol-3-phosphate acyltransferase [Candidatus Hydrogenedentes bacterium]|nr:1-acyl-sn-glycerol-3-phosphate acyltransferase [Candidatus Hydrogenedentota bacterium]